MSDAGCPKHMTYGPCGGVRPDLSCEMASHVCPFTAAPPIVWDRPVQDRVAAPAAGAPPLVVTDLTVAPSFDVASIEAITGLLRDSSDALLVGEHQNRPDHPPTLFASRVREAGGEPWMTLTCRDRNRLVLEQEVHGLAELGLRGVLCATGDGRAHGVRPGVTQVFDLDGPRLTELAASAGLMVAVPESPGSPPAAHRAQRLRLKQQAGAQVCILNHARVETVAALVGAARASGVTLPFIAGVAVFTDPQSAAALQGFPGLELDPTLVESILGADDPVRAGIDAAVQEAHALLQIPGVVGVNLSGRASAGSLEGAARIKAEIGRQVRSR